MTQEDRIGVESDVGDLPEPKQRTETDRIYDEQIERLDGFFASLQPGVSLLIERLKPSWCSGLLEEIQVSEDGMDLDYLIDTWGGHLLNLKIRGKRGRLVAGSYRVPLYSYPPLRYGELLTPHNKGERFKPDESEAQPAAGNVVVNSPQPAWDKVLAALPTVLPFVFKFFEAQESRRQADLAMMMNLMQANQKSPLGDISKLGAAMTQLNDVFAKNAGAGGGEYDFMTQALDVMKMVFDKPLAQTTTPAPAQSRLTGPQMTPPQSTGSQVHPQTLRPPNLASSIAQLPPEKATETFIHALGMMSSDKRETFVNSLIGEYQDTMGDDDSFAGDDADEFENRGIK